SWGFASLKLGISDCVVEVSLQGTIRLREQVPKAHGALHNSPKGTSSQGSWEGDHLALCEKKFIL
ncbi:hypothetical protein, partial [uncultured Fibrobacter sp.]|uniref:hypothetical protein n=1 Tax=uncultured Fibrobacter sp. TaxID=261512 RepID=UPI002804B367